MHTVPGGQNPDWHSDNPTNYAAFWDYKDHQDRTVWLWEQIAARYKENPWVAGYNPLNEPCDPEHVRLPAFYNRIEKAIRAVDEKHILWLDGNTFSMEWKGFTTVLPNCVYAMHDYSVCLFPQTNFMNPPRTDYCSRWDFPLASDSRERPIRRNAWNDNIFAK